MHPDAPLPQMPGEGWNPTPEQLAKVLLTLDVLEWTPMEIEQAVKLAHAFARQTPPPGN